MAFFYYGIIRSIGEFLLGRDFVKWLGSFVEDEKGHTSSKRLVLILSVTISGICILWIVACRGVYLLDHDADIGFELMVLMLGASGSGALAYMVGKPADRIKKEEAP